VLFCLALPLVIAFRSMPALDERGTSDATRPETKSIPIALLLRSRHFLSLAFVGFLMIATLSAMTGHFVPLLTSKGHSLTQSAAIAGLIGVASVIGRLATGMAMDRSSGPIIGVLCFAMPILTSILLLLDGGSAWVASVAALSLGLAAGAEMDVIGYVAARYFGSQGFGGVFSLLAVAMAVGFGVGPWAGSYSFDLTASYDLMLINVIPLSALAGLVLATLGPWRLVIPTAGEDIEPILAKEPSR
jgi:predicted MFS family arabinose efflux permease